MQRSLALSSLLAVLALACDKKTESPAPEPAKSEQPALDASIAATTAVTADAGAAAEVDPTEDEPTRGIALALSVTEPTGKKHARAEAFFRRPKSGKWETIGFDDPTSNAFYKVVPVLSSIEEPQLFTLGGDKAAVKSWRRAAEGFTPVVRWAEKVGTKADRMRDAELGDVDNNNASDIVVGTHDQGVLAYLKRNPKKLTEWQVEKLDKIPSTFLEEIELGDMDRDGALEIYVLPRDANPGKKGESPGKVLRYVPSKKEKRTVVADLGARQAREILVQDVDGDGADELYVALEGVTEGTGDATHAVEVVQILRFKANTPPKEGELIATIPDLSCRALTAGDVNGDGHRELFASCARAGVWALKHNGYPDQAWSVAQIEKDASGLQQAALATDVDQDGRDELYVAADDQRELRRYVWPKDEQLQRDVLVTRPENTKVNTYAITPVGR